MFVHQRPWLRAFAFGAAIVLGAAPAAAAGGLVFEDLNGDGLHQAGEPGVAGVVVSRGATLVRSDASGRYVLPEAEPDFAGFVVLTRPEGYDSKRWFRVGPGDFPLRRRTRDGSSFVFAHVSDVHISNRVTDFARYAFPGSFAPLPTWLSGPLMQLALSFQDPDNSSERSARALRAQLSRRSDTSDMSDARVMGEWMAAVRATGKRDDDPLIDPVGDFEASLAELRALGPRFVVSTGDLVLESNEANAASVARWMRFYRQRTHATGLEFYDTIGNNEIAGTSNPAFGPDDPGYGKALFRAHFGPTHYSFDRGGLHFVAIDTHAPEDGDPEDWSFGTLDGDVRAWLEADLALHAGRPTVVLNHEPFVSDPGWSALIGYVSIVDDDVTRLLEQAGVRWTLSGHVHVNGLAQRAATQHIVTGAFSGWRWSLPPQAFPRGYRLVQVRKGELYSVWKPTGEPVLGFVDPASDPAMHATAPRESRESAFPGRRRIVVAGADTAGPFVALTVRLGGRPLRLEHWSPYFFAAWYEPESVAPGENVLVAVAQRADGSVLRAQIELAEAAEPSP